VCHTSIHAYIQVRNALKLEDVPTVLVVGGGDGVGGLQKVAHNVGKK
jgi:UDP-N-acetylglucosamine:LPS N-acetylglucosamine transferase